MTESCEHHQLRLEAWIDGELTENETTVLRQHITQCSACTAYRAELLRLKDGLESLTLVQENPHVDDLVIRTIRRRTGLCFALAGTGLIALKLLDVLAVFGTGMSPRLIVAVGVLSIFSLLRINPIRIVHMEELSPVGPADRGVNHATS